MEDKLIKVILEVDFLSKKHIKMAVEAICKIHEEEKTKLVIKTKTGFGDGKFLNSDAVLLIKTLLEECNLYGEDKIQIKASGGIKTKEEATVLLNSGAHILGVGRGKEMLTE